MMTLTRANKMFPVRFGNNRTQRIRIIITKTEADKGVEKSEIIANHLSRTAREGRNTVDFARDFCGGVRLPDICAFRF